MHRKQLKQAVKEVLNETVVMPHKIVVPIAKGQRVGLLQKPLPSVRPALRPSPGPGGPDPLVPGPPGSPVARRNTVYSCE